MKAIDLIRWAMQKTDEWTTGAAEDLRDSAMVPPNAQSGNHPLWTVGHLAVVEGNIRQMLFGDPNPLEHWKPLFDQGSTPTADASAYPSYDEVLAAYRDLRAKNLARLEEIGEAGLDREPATIPPGFQDEMRSIGRLLLLIALHQMSHVGQLSVVRRAVGKALRF